MFNFRSYAYGDAFYHEKGNLIVNNSTFINNTLNSSYSYGSHESFYSYSYSYSYSGAFYHADGILRMVNVAFINNTFGRSSVYLGHLILKFILIFLVVLFIM